MSTAFSQGVLKRFSGKTKDSGCCNGIISRYYKSGYRFELLPNGIALLHQSNNQALIVASVKNGLITLKTRVALSEQQLSNLQNWLRSSRRQRYLAGACQPLPNTGRSQKQGKRLTVPVSAYAQVGYQRRRNRRYAKNSG